MQLMQLSHGNRGACSKVLSLSASHAHGSVRRTAGVRVAALVNCTRTCLVGTHKQPQSRACCIQSLYA